MLGRLLTKAAVLLVALLGSAANANEPGRDEGKTSASQTTGRDQAAPSGQSAKPVATTRTDGIAPRNPRVVFITANDSESCRRELERLRKAGGGFAALQAAGWKIGPAADSHIQLVDRLDVPDLIRQLAANEFPAVACIQDGEVIRSFKDGCSTPLDAWTFGWLLKGTSERPKAAIPEPIRVATTGNYPLRGNHWSVDGDTIPTQERLVSHLRSPNHVNSLNAAWKIEEWSLEELRSLHDDIHEREGGAAAYVAQPKPAASPYAATNKALGKFGR